MKLSQKIIWGLIYFFVIALILFCLLVATIYFSPPKYSGHTLAKYDLNDFDNGDLVFLSGDSYGEKTVRFFTGSPWSHVAMVIKEYEKIEGLGDETKFLPKIYLYECDLGSKVHEGVRLISLERKLNRKELNNVMALRKINKPLDKDTLLDLYEKNKDIGFDHKMAPWIWWKFGFHGEKDSQKKEQVNSQKKEKDSLFCSEMIIKTMIELDILPKNAKPYTYTPEDLFSTKLMTNLKYSYSDPIYFKLK